MSGYKILIDTNVFIGLEDPRTVDPATAELVRKCAEHSVSIFVHEAALRDISRDRDCARREISLSKLRKFQELRGIKLPNRTTLESQFGAIKRANDEVDVALLYALSLNAVDFLISEDQALHERVKLSPLAKRVLTVADALQWLTRTFDPVPAGLPLISEQKAHEIDIEDDLFDSLRYDYADFDRWWHESCIPQHRRCWTVYVDRQLAGLIVRKDETHDQAHTFFPGPKIFKLCTFKVRDRFRGEKLGELLLKQALWFAQKNRYDLVYLTTYPTQTFLIQLLEYYGFQHTISRPDGERVYEKPMQRSRPALEWGYDLFTIDRMSYPRFVADAPARVFCVPIQGEYHRKLFPEIAFAKPLPLFPQDELISPRPGERLPGNTIRKVYLCRSNTKALASGDVLLFYLSKSSGLSASQSLTSVAIVENVTEAGNLEQLVRITGKRSVFSEAELDAMVKAGDRPLRAIDFLLIGHIAPPVTLQELLTMGVFKSQPPQSISQLTAAQFSSLRHRLNLGFDV